MILRVRTSPTPAGSTIYYGLGLHTPRTRVLWSQPRNLRVHVFQGDRRQWDQPCPSCLKGSARVTAMYAPDAGQNWWKCDQCGHEYV